MAMGIVRSGCSKSIAWHEAMRQIDVFGALPKANSRCANSLARGRSPTRRTLIRPQDEPIREWPGHSQEKPAAIDRNSFSWRSSGSSPALRQQRRRDPKLSAAMRTAHRLKTYYPMQKCRHRFDDHGFRRRHGQRRAGSCQSDLPPRWREQAIVPDALEPAGQHMQQKAGNELAIRQATWS